MGDLSCGFSTIAFQALSENGARRAVGRKADLCPARAGRGLPAACRAEWAAVVEWNGAGLRAIAATAGLMDQRRRSPAKPDGLGGVVWMLTGAAVILGERRILSCAEAWALPRAREGQAIVEGQNGHQPHFPARARVRNEGWDKIVPGCHTSPRARGSGKQKGKICTFETHFPARARVRLPVQQFFVA